MSRNSDWSGPRQPSFLRPLQFLPISMEERADLHDWELVYGPEFADNHKTFVILGEDSKKVDIKADYFAFDSGDRRDPRLEEEEDSDEAGEGGVDSDNPSSVDPDSDPNKFLEVSSEQMGFAGMKFPIRVSGGFSSEELSDGLTSPADNEKLGLGSSGESVMEMESEENEPGCENFEGGSEESEISGSREVTADIGALGITEGEKREKVWWKMPLELLKFCFFGMRPVWSVSLAATVLGIAMLVRKLYRMKHKSRSIRLKIAIDDKKSSQFVARATRLNEAISMVRRMPIIRPSLQAGGAAQWRALPLR